MRKKISLTTAVLFFAAALFLAAALCPYAVWKAVGDRLSPDGSMERLTAEAAAFLRLASAGCCAVFGGLAAWSLSSPKSFRRFFMSAAALPGRFFRDAAPFFMDLGNALRPKSSGFLLMILILAAGTALRVLRLGEPLLHDEAYSMAIWGRADLHFAVSDYHLPNNHIFHTVLLNLIYHHLGKSPELMRLPVLISGCLLIPAVWLLGRLVYNDFIALTAAGLTAFAPFLVFYSVNARGYELQALLTVLTFGLAVYGKRRRNIFAWALLILLSALNFYTLPIALYPFGAVCVWLFLNVLFWRPEKNAFSGRGQFFKYLIVMGLSVTLLTALLYSPLLLTASGRNSLFGNVFIGGTDAATYGETLISRAADSVRAFTDLLPLPVIIIIAAGLVLSPFMFRRNSAEHISYGAALLLWMLLLIPFQRPNLWPRTLIFLHPFLQLFCASGLSLMKRIRGAEKAAAWICAALILFAAIPQFRSALNSRGTAGADETAVQCIAEREGANAGNILFVAAAQNDAPLWYYADLYDIPGTVFDKRNAFNTVYAFVNPLNDADEGPKDLDDLLARFGPGEAFMDMGSIGILMERPDGILYRFEVRESAIRKGYGTFPERPSE